MLDFDLYHITLHPISSWESESELQVGSQTIRMMKGVKTSPDFGIPFEEFAEKITTQFDATYEYDSSFGFFLNGESISGQIGASPSDQLNFLELHQCKTETSFDAIVALLNDRFELGVQVLELGAFVSQANYRTLLKSIQN
ncbi:hypothetical protein OAF56_00550 [Pirellulaceae bacterium]|nr:hypothetical protein [bacterium]MDB4640096.1 hypothetical protein [Pirellulaceae bacterium]